MSETSPHPWGKRAFENLSDWLQGNIPTPVGKTRLSPVAGTPKRKHPHARGEDCGTSPGCTRPTETSPRPWGRRNRRAVRSNALRNIPTPVGKTDNHKSSQSRKHPHACGEDLRACNLIYNEWETSPRLWGRLTLATVSCISLGNIPTPVGKTMSQTSLGCREKKHPHACGEDGGYLSASPVIRETSPRLWGRLTVRDVICFSVRNIPTPVGKTGASTPQGAMSKKHPHACGED